MDAAPTVTVQLTGRHEVWVTPQTVKVAPASA